MSKKLPVGTKQDRGSMPGGLNNVDRTVDTTRDMGKVTPKKAQTNKKNYAITPYQANGCKS